MLATQSFIALSLLLSSFLSSASASPMHARHAHVRRRSPVEPRAPISDNNGAVLSAPRRRSTAKRCAKKASSTALASTAAPTSSAAHSAVGNVGGKPSSAVVASTSSSKAAPASTQAATPTTPASSDNGSAEKPAHWPTKTQAAATYSATAASAADPMLLSVSEALNNENNELFTSTKTGDLTYYGQGLGACGDTYDDESFTAAVSHDLYDSWPGSTAETNRSPLCGPYTPGRQTMNALGLFETSLTSSIGNIMIGGDGLPNCNPIVGQMCHIPLTATITNPHTGKSAVVKIVDRCAGCQPEDIDVTPAVFRSIADMSEGRVSGITWNFNRF